MDVPNNVEPAVKINGWAVRMSALVQIGLLVAALIGGWYKLKTEFSFLSKQVERIDEQLHLISTDLSKTRENVAINYEKSLLIRDALVEVRQKLGIPVPVMPVPVPSEK